MKAINRIFVTVDKRFNDEHTMENGQSLFLDCSYNPEENANVVGTVVAVPEKPNLRGLGDSFVFDVQVGDKLYFNFMVTSDEGNSIEHNGITYWMVDLFNAIAVVRDGKIIPFGNYILIEPIKEKLESSLIIVPDSTEKEGTKGIVFASNDDQLPVGTIVEFEAVGQFWNIIEGQRVFCMFNSNILYKHDEKRRSKNH